RGGGARVVVTVLGGLDPRRGRALARPQQIVKGGAERARPAEPWRQRRRLDTLARAVRLAIPAAFGMTLQRQPRDPVLGGDGRCHCCCCCCACSSAAEGTDAAGCRVGAVAKVRRSI